jgi:cytosine-specific methyltransferase
MFSYGSVCSGIEAVSVAWQDFATPLWFSEIEPFPCALLQHHYPNVPNLGDMQNLPQKILNREIPAPDVLIGGTPCQSYSYAGKRHSLNDERGGLMLTFTQPITAGDSKTLHVICVHGTQDPITSHKTAHCLGRNSGQENVISIQAGTRLRRLTPTECERLMGFPDNYTQIPYRNKPALHCPDTPRYKALGNSMAVPVVRWIGQRLIRQLTTYGKQ